MKESFRLTKENLQDFHVWFTPVQSIRRPDQDETMVLPFLEEVFSLEAGPESKVIVSSCGCREIYGFAPIVFARFTDIQKREYLGYLSWSTCRDLSALQPVMFIGDEAVRLYRSEKPSRDELTSIRNRLGASVFPISVATEDVCGLASISCTLHGVHFLSDGQPSNGSLVETFVVP